MVPDVYDCGVSDLGVGHWREHGDLQRSQRRPDQTAAVSAAPRVGRSLACGARRDVDWRQHQLLAHHVFHVSRGEPNVPGVWAVVERRSGHNRRGRTGARAGAFVTYGTLQALGVQPTLGRWFSQADDTPGSEETVMLTYGYWQRRFGSDASVVGRTLTVDSKPRKVIGVMPQGFRFLNSNMEVILPQRFERNKIFLGN